MSDSQHAEFPPSSLEHYNNCPGFIQAVSLDDCFSEKGTRLHKAWEGKEPVELTPDEADAVRVVRECEPRGKFGTPSHEMKVNCAGITWGTLDYLQVDWVNKTGYLVDGKFGRIGVQPAQTNIQIWCYSLGIWAEFAGVEEVRATVAAPYRGEVTIGTFHRKTHYDSFKFYIARIIEKVVIFRKTGDVSMLAYHPKTCAFCSRINCPIKQRRVAEAAGATMLPFPAEVEPGELNAIEIAQAKILANQAKRWIAEVDKRAMELSDHGHLIPGFERKFMSGRKKAVGDLQIKELWHVVLKIVPIPFGDLMFAAAEVNIPACVQLIRLNSPAGQKEKNEQKFLDALRDADIGQPSGGYYYLKPKPEIYDEPK